MTVDTATEYLTLHELADRIGGLDKRRTGKSCHIQTVRRWVREGIKDVQLKHVRRLGRIVTTWKWYEEFERELTAAYEQESKRHRQAAARGVGPDRGELAMQQLEAEGLL